MALKPITRKFIYINDEMTAFIDCGERGYMCPQCKTITYTKTDTTEFFNEDGGKPKIFYTCTCKDCGLTRKVKDGELLDPNIAEAISYFNRAGLKTNFSCEGNDGENMYIVFDDDRILKYVDMLPDYVCLRVEHVYTNSNFIEYEIKNEERECVLRPLFSKPSDEFREEVLNNIKIFALKVYALETSDS